MRKSGIRIISVFLIIIMLLSCFAACSDENASSSETENSDTTITVPVSSDSEQTDAEIESLRAMAVKYAGKIIGVQIGTVFDTIINKYIPEAEIAYYNSNADMALALKAGKISAYIADEPMARLLCQSYTNQYITGVFEKSPYAYIYPKNSEKTEIIREQMNEFLAKINADGTIKQIDNVWFGNDESQKIVDTSDLTGENGTLEFAIVSAVGAPFVYVKDNSYAGYDVDIAVRFCREYGYKINITDYNVGGLFASVSSGLSDFGASSICITEERKEEMDFSDPNYEGSVVLVTKDNAETDISKISDSSVFDVLKGKTIAVVGDSINGSYLESLIPNCNIVGLDNAEELASELEAGNIDAYLDDQPLVRYLLTKYPNQHVLGVCEKADYGFIFQKDNSQSDSLRAQMNGFLAEITANGILEEIDSIWFGSDESLQEIDFSDLTGENGTIRFAINTTTGKPFCYEKYGNFCGYEIDIAYRFCKRFGYNLEFVNTEFFNIFELVNTGECDIGFSCITITEERQETFNFSDPDYHGGTVIVIKKEDEFDVSKISGSSKFSELNGKKIGYLTGSIYKDAAENVIDSPDMIAYPSSANVSMALEKGEIDAYVTDQPLARIYVKSYKDHYVHSVISQNEYAFGFQKNNPDYPNLKEQMNSFIKDIKYSGLLNEIDNVWIGDNISLQDIDFTQLTGENGTLKMAITTSIGAPFCYSDNAKYYGYDIDIAVRFCAYYGYNLEIYNFDNIQQAMDGVIDGEYDLCGSFVTISEERKQLLDFSSPYYYGGIVVIAKGIDNKNTPDINFMLTSLVNSFKKTFIRENRWKMFASGLEITVLLTVLSAFFGSTIGFGLFLIYRKGKKFINAVIDCLSKFMQMTPVVVILMIFYYLLFSKAEFSGVAVSVIAFSIMFACSVVTLLGNAVDAVDEGQLQAVRALGYKDTQGFIRMILPQAIPHFVTGYQGEMVSLIKSTSIVSYVAVQDLTMVTDIIRSRTYDAFFPLIATAIIYFLMALLLTTAVRKISLISGPYNRKETQILKGVKTK